MKIFKSSILLALALLLAYNIPTATAGKKAVVKAKQATDKNDSEYDPIGNTCKPGGACTYGKSTVLPGNIPVSIEVVSLGGFNANVEQVFDYTISEVRRVAQLLDENDPSSEVSKVNDNAGKGFVEVGPEFVKILSAAKKAYDWTNGAFDITATPEIGTFKNVKISNNLVLLKRKGMKITFKNMISGYIADLIITALYNANLDNALATAGHTSRSIGESVAGHWRTQVDDGEGTYAKRGMTLDTSNVSVGSAIRGENAPTIDPRWASPIEGLCRSVTVISRNAAISEAIAQAVFIAGPDRGLVMMSMLQNVRGVIVDNAGNFIKSQGL